MLKKQDTKQLFNKIQTGNFRIAIIKTDYHSELVSELEKYAIETLSKNGVKIANIATFTVPGSWEIPLFTQTIAESKKFDAVITFGVIVKGETYHFEMIANGSARALMQISLDYGIPVALEILAVYDKKQAIERASNNEHNKGIEAAITVLKMLEEMKKVNV
jgi:6,7-dimethyl-8-ribityllumazine synthase